MSASKKLSREKELATLPELLKIRIQLFRLDTRFEPHEGTEVRMCMVAKAIHTIHESGKEWLEATKIAIEEQAFPEKIGLSADNLMLALDLAKAMDEDVRNGISIFSPEAEDVTVSATLNVRCSASNELGLEGYMARPREKYIKKFLSEVSLKPYPSPSIH